jgi:hypothetical protein
MTMVLRPIYRITTFVPPAKLEALLDGITRVVPLKIGNYDSVSWVSVGVTERFRPLPGSNPTAGKQGELEQVESVRLEFTIPRDPALLERLLTEGLIPHHPWEEPAVFIDETTATQTQTGD